MEASGTIARLRGRWHPVWGLRLAVLLLAGSDLLETPLHDHWWIPTIALASFTASMVSTAWPVVGFWMTLALMLPTPWLHGNDGWPMPMVVSTVGLVATRTVRTAVLTVASYTAACLVMWRSSRIQLSPAMLVLLGVLAAVGTAARLLLARREAGQRRIARMDAAVQALRRDERQGLARELSALLADSLDRMDEELATGPTEDDLGLRARLARVDEQSRTTLVRLQRLVAVLREQPDVASPGAGVDLSEQLELLEDELTSRAFWVEVELDADPLPVAPAGLVSDALRWATEHALREASAGAPCEVQLVTRDGRVRACLRHEQAGAGGGGPTGSVVTHLAERARTLGGRLDAGLHDGWWELVVDLPLDPPAPDPGGFGDAGGADGQPSRARGLHGLVVRLGGPAKAFSLLVSLLSVGALVEATSLVLMAGSVHDALPPLRWALYFCCLLVCSRWPRWGPAVLAALLAVCMLTVAPQDFIMDLPDLVAASLAIAVVVRRPVWAWGYLAAWVVASTFWDLHWGRPVLLWLLWLKPLFGLMIGIAVQYFVSTRREQQARMRELERARRQAAAQERTQLAYELHDVVAHQLSQVSLEVQAVAGQQGHAAVAGTLERVTELVHGARHDVESLLAVLRSEAGGHEDRPTPGRSGATEARRVARLQRLVPFVRPGGMRGVAGRGAVAQGVADPGTGPLDVRSGVEQARQDLPTTTARSVADSLERAGHRVTLRLDADVNQCDPTVLRTATRVLREAGTNALRYAPQGSACMLEVATTDELLVVRLTSPLPASTQPHPLSTGLGLAALAERVRLTGGHFTAGATLDMWRVAAEMPRRPAGN